MGMALADVVYAPPEQVISSHFFNDSENPLQTVLIQNYSSLAALILLIWDWVDTFQNEIKFVWSKPLSPMKVAFLLARYYGLVCQVVNNILTTTRISNLPVSAHVCRQWHEFLNVSFGVLYFTSDAVLMIRVHTLYKRSRKVGMWLATQFTLEVAALAVSSWNVLKVTHYAPACHDLAIPPTIIIWSVVIILSQTIIMVFTFLKHHAGDDNSKRNPLMDVIFRDGGWSWLVFSAVVGVLIPCAFIRQYARPHLLMTWPTTVFSIATCRLVLNVNKAAWTGRPALPITGVDLPTIYRSEAAADPIFSPDRESQHQILPMPAPSRHHSFKSSLNSFMQSSTEISSEPSPPLAAPRAPSRISPNARSLSSLNAHDFDDDSLHRMPSVELDEYPSGKSADGRVEVGSLRNSEHSMCSEEWREYWNEML